MLPNIVPVYNTLIERKQNREGLLWESRGYPISGVAKGSQYITTASPLDALDLGHPRLSLN
jgi:hypothetical protein